MERDNRAARPGADGVGCAVIRIAISVEAFDAIAATLPFVSVEQAINEHGPRYVWLKRSVLERLLGNGARTIIVESPDRFARDLIQQLLGRDMLKAKGAALIAASAPQHFTEDTPTAVLVRQILGGVAEFEKTTLVAKLKAARERKKAVTGKCGGRKSFAERDALWWRWPRSSGAIRSTGASARSGTSRSRSRRRATSTSAASCSTRSRSPPCWLRGARRDD